MYLVWEKLKNIYFLLTFGSERRLRLPQCNAYSTWRLTELLDFWLQDQNKAEAKQDGLVSL